jgi:hypothetical protein
LSEFTPADFIDMSGPVVSRSAITGEVMPSKNVDAGDPPTARTLKVKSAVQYFRYRLGARRPLREKASFPAAAGVPRRAKQRLEDRARRATWTHHAREHAGQPEKQFSTANVRQEMRLRGAWRSPGTTAAPPVRGSYRLSGGDHTFHLAGFAWDYSGKVTSCDGGRLAL